jgi:hypothetical protein
VSAEILPFPSLYGRDSSLSEPNIPQCTAISAITASNDQWFKRATVVCSNCILPKTGCCCQETQDNKVTVERPAARSLHGDLADHASALVGLAEVRVVPCRRQLHAERLARSVQQVLAADGVRVHTRRHGILVEHHIVGEAYMALV